MNKTQEALCLALEALENSRSLEPVEVQWVKGKRHAAITAIREALAEQETVLPGGGHVPAVSVAVYGYCPECGGAGVMRERRPNGDDKCTNGHKYPSSKALAEQPAQDNTYNYAKSLAEAIFKQHFASDEHYASGRVVWGVNDTVIGILTQIDNMVADMVRRPAQQQEPVAWMLEWTFNGEERGRRLYDDETHCVFDAENDGGVCRPLYTTPPHRKPLTDEEIYKIANDLFYGNGPCDTLAMCRAIEAAHGIKGDA